jgi:hypothetical protein
VLALVAPASSKAAKTALRGSPTITCQA